jgi:hypothetical protein
MARSPAGCRGDDYGGGAPRASRTITFCPNVIDSSHKRYAATTSCGDALENLIQCGLIRVGDQTASKVFLQGLMLAGGR